MWIVIISMSQDILIGLGCLSASFLGAFVITAVRLAKSRKSERMLRTMIDSTPDLMFIFDKKHRYRLVNKAFSLEHRQPADYFVGKTALQIGIDEEIVKGNPVNVLIGLWADDREVIRTGVAKTIPELEI